MEADCLHVPSCSTAARWSELSPRMWRTYFFLDARGLPAGGDKLPKMAVRHVNWFQRFLLKLWFLDESLRVAECTVIATTNQINLQ